MQEERKDTPWHNRRSSDDTPPSLSALHTSRTFPEPSVACTFCISSSTRFSRGSGCTPLFHQNTHKFTTVDGHGSDFRRLLRVFVVFKSKCILVCGSTTANTSSPCTHDHNTKQWMVYITKKQMQASPKTNMALLNRVSNKDVVIVLFMSKQSTVGKELSSVLLTHFGTVTRILQHIVLLVLSHLSHELRRISSPVLNVTSNEDDAPHQQEQSFPAPARNPRRGRSWSPCERPPECGNPSRCGSCHQFCIRKESTRSLFVRGTTRTYRQRHCCQCTRSREDRCRSTSLRSQQICPECGSPFRSSQSSHLL